LALLDAKAIQLGKRKVYLNSNVLELLDVIRGQTLQSYIVIIQAWARATLGRRLYLHKLKAIVIIQRARRAIIEYRKLNLKRMSAAARTIQKFYRKIAAKRIHAMMMYIKYHIIYGERPSFSRKKLSVIPKKPKKPPNLIDPSVLRRMRRLARDEKSKAVADLAIGAFYFGLEPIEYLRSKNKSRKEKLLRIEAIQFFVHGKKVHFPKIVRATHVSIALLSSHNESWTIPRSFSDPYLCPVEAWIRVVSRIYDVGGCKPSTPLCAYGRNNIKQYVFLPDLKASLSSANVSLRLKKKKSIQKKTKKRGFHIIPSQRLEMLEILNLYLS